MYPCRSDKFLLARQDVIPDDPSHQARKYHYSGQHTKSSRRHQHRWMSANHRCSCADQQTSSFGRAILSEATTIGLVSDRPPRYCPDYLRKAPTHMRCSGQKLHSDSHTVSVDGCHGESNTVRCPSFQHKDFPYGPSSQL